VLRFKLLERRGITVKKYIGTIALIAVVLTVNLFALGCTAGHDAHVDSSDRSFAGETLSYSWEEDYYWEDMPFEPLAMGDVGSAAAPERLREVERLITSSSVDIRSDDVRDTAQQLREKASSIGGKIQEEFTSTSDRPFGRIVVSVPTEQVSDYLAWIEESFDVEVFDISRANVARTYYANIETIESLQVRLKLTQELQSSDHYTDLNTQLRLIDRIASLESEIARFTDHNEEIDQAVAYSDISISINGVARIAWEANFWRNTLQTCATILEAIVRTIIIASTIALPFTPFIILGVWISKRHRKRKEAELG
jgi:prepilin signal peptidase PulO-like enzyme (type II secretory pathway)